LPRGGPALRLARRRLERGSRTTAHGHRIPGGSRPSARTLYHNANPSGYSAYQATIEGPPVLAAGCLGIDDYDGDVTGGMAHPRAETPFRSETHEPRPLSSEVVP
jgi:hypothetical protein